MKDEPNKVGRPRNEYTEEQAKQVIDLAEIMCTEEEIAHITGIPQSSLNRDFGLDIKKAKDTGRMSLRRRQWQQAADGSVPMQIWLGKQWLDQVDKSHTESKTDVELSTSGSLAVFLGRLSQAAPSGDTDGADG